MKKTDLYRYFKGEKQNPFDREKQNASFMFWGYEQWFEEMFNQGDFSLNTWLPASSDEQQRKEWSEALSRKPIDKEELFKLWLFELLMNRLPDKYESESDHFNKLYWATTSMSI